MLKSVLKIIILIIFLIENGYAVDNLGKDNIVGCWIAEPPITDGERSFLKISEGLTATLTREFLSGRSVVAKGNTDFCSDLLVIDFNVNGSEHRLKLVGSGWSSEMLTLMFGMLYLFEGDEVFNGLPARFKAIPCTE